MCARCCLATFSIHSFRLDIRAVPANTVRPATQNKNQADGSVYTAFRPMTICINLQSDRVSATWSSVGCVFARIGEVVVSGFLSALVALRLELLAIWSSSVSDVYFG